MRGMLDQTDPLNNKVGSLPRKNKVSTENVKLTWLTVDINFELLHIRCPIPPGRMGDRA